MIRRLLPIPVALLVGHTIGTVLRGAVDGTLGVRWLG